jgi:hypothetical protein
VSKKASRAACIPAAVVAGCISPAEWLGRRGAETRCEGGAEARGVFGGAAEEAALAEPVGEDVEGE